MTAHTFCPQCGWGVKIDDDGLCCHCGCTATGAAKVRTRPMTDAFVEWVKIELRLRREHEPCLELSERSVRNLFSLTACGVTELAATNHNLADYCRDKEAEISRLIEALEDARETLRSCVVPAGGCDDAAALCESLNLIDATLPPKQGEE